MTSNSSSSKKHSTLSKDNGKCSPCIGNLQNPLIGLDSLPRTYLVIRNMNKLSPILAFVGAIAVIAAKLTTPESDILLFAGAAIALASGALGFTMSPTSSQPAPTPEAKSEPEPQPAVIPPAPEPAPKGIPTDGLVLVSQLQEKGRFLDFLMDDISAYPDAQVGAAARVIHQGCKGVITTAFAPQPVSSSPEGTQISLEADYNTHNYRVSGELSGEAPYTVTLQHKGWKPTQCILPEFQGTLSSPNEYTFAPAQVSGK